MSIKIRIISKRSSELAHENLLVITKQPSLRQACTSARHHQSINAYILKVWKQIWAATWESDQRCSVSFEDHDQRRHQLSLISIHCSHEAWNLRIVTHWALRLGECLGWSEFTPCTLILLSLPIYTHYYNSNLNWGTVSCQVDKVISSDHLRREASRVIQWYDVILYARSSYFYNNMFMIYLFLTLFLFYKLLWSLIQKNFENVCHYVLSHHIHIIQYDATSFLRFSVSGSMLEIYFT